ncbi:hypothetical protein [Streptomyces olivaceus]|uniref:hypothetical protein n=1 Tax=Streptomyces olivaceus TaxID=47716 RepID=UPI0004C91E73|nr:hypothetical protein [Streptomyces olivaceus]MBZ6102756.1 hypothetical protein [Streptomyces olivaceus]
MTPADELRAAADKIRQLATAAADDSGNTAWKASRHFPDQPDSTFTTLWAVGVKPLLRGGRRPPAYVSAPVGDYAATMDPAVGLALADWLEWQAAALDEGRIAIPDAALAVARQINGTP